MWSISIYSGDSPFALKPATDSPVLTKDHVTDVPAAFVADPFLVRHDHTWYMFFEVMNAERGLGEIGLATSNNALTWTYQRIVLKESFHLSYPYVFQWHREFYMIPESIGAGAILLYKALAFPDRWLCIAKLIDGSFADPSIFRFNDLWWMFACPTPYQHDTLRLYLASQLPGRWIEHPKSPIIRGDKCRARPAGRVLKFNGRLFRFAQDCLPQYGTSVGAFMILQLTLEHYAEVELASNPILRASGSGWNASGMHHIDACRQVHAKWLACVDGTQ